MEEIRRRNYGGQNTGSESRGNRGYGSNFGDDARPYGEDYGEDRGYEQRPQSRYNIQNRMQSGNRAGFRHQRFNEPQDWMMEDQGFDYGMTRTGSHANVGRFHFGDYDEMDEPQSRRGDEAGTGRGYMSDDDYDRGSPYYSQNRGYGGAHGMREENRRGYSQEDYPQYRERYNRSNYPDTYRSARSGYMSEYVGDDAGRELPGLGRHSRREMEDGPHRGKGPRNYKRSDERIREEINERLTDDPFVDCSDVEVRVENGQVILTGSVVDKTQQRRIEDIAGSVRGVTEVENRLRRPLMATPF